MGDYHVRIKRSAEKEIRAIQDASTRQRIVAAVGALSSEPRPSGCRKLVGTEAYRLRVGRYRIVYTVEDRIVTVTVVRVADRKHAYR